MTKGRMALIAVGVVVVLGAIGAASGGSKTNQLANTPTPSPVAGASAAEAAVSAAPQATDQPSLAPAVSAAPSVAPVSSAYGVGDRVKLGDEEFFTVAKVEKGWSGGLVKPDAGNVFVAVLVQIEGINPSGASYNPFYFKARDSDGFEYNQSFFGKDPSLSSSNNLKPGAKVQGWMTFEVPKSATSILMAYAPGFLGEPAEFKLY